jgi:HPt (histidine-containing phosphotransfer) domain-containing protein
MLSGFEELVPGYLARQRRDVSGMISLLAASDYDRLEVLGHNMKGSGSSYGFAELTRFGAELESAAMRADHDALALQIPQLDDYLSRVQLISV